MSVDYEQPDDKAIRETAAEMPARYFKGDELKPFSFARQAACQRLTAGSGAKSLETATILVFVCTLDRADLEKTRQPAGRAAFFEQMEKWADDHKIGLMTTGGAEVQRIADEIWLELEASEGQPQEPKTKPGTKVEAPPPNGDCREAQRST